jgi:hypothetical protein
MCCDGDRATRLTNLVKGYSLPQDHIFLSALLLVHWRNRIVHSRSKANLSNQQRMDLVAASSTLAKDYKNLDAKRVLLDFDRNAPTLKDASSLTAMAITLARRIEAQIPYPSNGTEVRAWLAHCGLTAEVDRAIRVSGAKGKLEQGISTLLRTHFPDIEPAYMSHCLPRTTTAS